MPSRARTNTRIQPAPESSAQHEFPFDVAFTEMALQVKCDESNANHDLHLVVLDAGEHQGEARLLAAAPRFIRRRETEVSIPLGVVTVPLLERLRRLGKVPAGDECVDRIAAIAKERQRARWAERSKKSVQLEIPLEECSGSSMPSLL